MERNLGDTPSSPGKGLRPSAHPVRRTLSFRRSGNPGWADAPARGRGTAQNPHGVFWERCPPKADRESEGAHTSRASFALPGPPIGARRGRSRVDAGQDPKSEILRGCRDSSLPRVWGCPPILFSHPPRVGVRGLKRVVNIFTTPYTGRVFDMMGCRRERTEAALLERNGIRAVASKGFLEWLRKEQPDILCLNETKAQPEQLDQALREPEGYHVYWSNPRRRATVAWPLSRGRSPFGWRRTSPVRASVSTSKAGLS